VVGSKETGRNHPHQPSPWRIEHSVPRKEKRITCITTISSADDVLMPLLVIHQKTVDDAVWEDSTLDSPFFCEEVLSLLAQTMQPNSKNSQTLDFDSYGQ
jgi:hypothetical protein